MTDALAFLEGLACGFVVTLFALLVIAAFL